MRVKKTGKFLLFHRFTCIIVKNSRASEKSVKKMQKNSRIRSIDFGVKPFKKGLVGVQRAKPSVCTGIRNAPFFTTSEAFHPHNKTHALPIPQ